MHTSFAAVKLTARQNDRVLATSSVCMHVVGEGLEHQSVADVPPVLGQDALLWIGT